MSAAPDRTTTVLAATLRQLATDLGLPDDCTRADLLAEVRRLRDLEREGRVAAPTVGEVNEALLAGSLLLAPSGVPVVPAERERERRREQANTAGGPLTRERFDAALRAMRATMQPDDPPVHQAFRAWVDDVAQPRYTSARDVLANLPPGVREALADEGTLVGVDVGRDSGDHTAAVVAHADPTTGAIVVDGRVVASDPVPVPSPDDPYVGVQVHFRIHRACDRHLNRR